MSEELKILLIEDSDTDADLLLRFLKKECIDFSHSRVRSKEHFINILKEQKFDLIIADLLCSIQNKTMKEQEKHLDNFMEEWKGGAEKLDDILIIGIRQE